MEENRYRSPEEDLGTVELGDARLNRRLISSVEDRVRSVEQTRSSAKGFYRLLANDKFEREKLEESMRKATIERITQHERVLLVQDTTDINLNGHKKTENLGYCSNNTKGIKLHDCMAVACDGIPLGLLIQQYETREEAKLQLSESEKKVRPIEEKESYRWIETLKKSIEQIPAGVEAITICDREGDIFELYEQALELESSFVIRASYDRKTQTGEKSFAKIRSAPVIGYAAIDIPRDSRKNRKARRAQMAVSSCSVSVSKKKTSLSVNMIRIFEITETQEPVEWILITNLPVDTSDKVMEIVGYYVHRWKIERFHYVLKSGCKVEEIQQRSYERILPVILICSMIANFILAMTYLGRAVPGALCDMIFEEDEWKLLYRFAKKTKIPPDKPYSLAQAIEFLGQLGAGKRAPSDGPYGEKSIWLGLKIFYSAVDLLVGQV